MIEKNYFVPEAMLFDLDGTLLDTAPDLTTALNLVLVQHNRPVLSLNQVRPTIAGGSPTILQRGFGITPEDSLFPLLRTAFLNAYQQCLHQNTQFFKGIETVLAYLEQQNIPWGVVTNKPGWLAEPLLMHFKLHHRYRCLVAGDLLPQRKPDPAPLLHACRLLNVSPQQSVYVGDAENDVRAAKAAGLFSIVAKYGYLSEESEPHQWQADILIETAEEIITWLKI